MEVQDDHYCIVCGKENPIGFKLDFKVDSEAKKAKVLLKISKNFQGWNGIVHGGIIATLLDEVGVYAATPLGKNMVTAEINIKYKKPVPIEKELLLEGEVTEVKRGKIIYVKAKITHKETLLAYSEAKILLL